VVCLDFSNLCQHNPSHYKALLGSKQALTVSEGLPALHQTEVTNELLVINFICLLVMDELLSNS
jgi:hypothetical protein